MTYGYGNFRSNPTDCPHGRTCLATRQIYRPGVITEISSLILAIVSFRKVNYFCLLFNNRFFTLTPNAGAESFNAKVKAFRSQFRGVTDIPFFLFRLAKLCA